MIREVIFLNEDFAFARRVDLRPWLKTQEKIDQTRITFPIRKP